MVTLGNSANADTAARVQGAVASIEHVLGDRLVDLIPSYASVLVIFNALSSSHRDIAAQLRVALSALDTTAAAGGKRVTLPVYYSPESGADLALLAERAGLTIDDVIGLHSAAEYRVYAIGFAPGFAYLGKVDERIAAPRRETPRRRVPRGSVAIADRQTAVYPATSPGGWNLIGLCPTPMFNSSAIPCMPVQVGDSVRFEPVTRDAFFSLGGELP